MQNRTSCSTAWASDDVPSARPATLPAGSRHSNRTPRPAPFTGNTLGPDETACRRTAPSRDRVRHLGRRRGRGPAGRHRGWTGGGEPKPARTLPELTCAVAFERHRSSSAPSPSRPASTRRGDAPTTTRWASGRTPMPSIGVAGCHHGRRAPRGRNAAEVQALHRADHPSDGVAVAWELKEEARECPTATGTRAWPPADPGRRERGRCRRGPAGDPRHGSVRRERPGSSEEPVREPAQEHGRTPGTTSERKPATTWTYRGECERRPARDIGASGFESTGPTPSQLKGVLATGPTSAARGAHGGPPGRQWLLGCGPMTANE